MSYVRTPEHRELRAKLIRQWRPWEKSTGPRSEEGKILAAKRSFKGNHRGLLRELSNQIEMQKKSLKVVSAKFAQKRN